MDPYDPALAPPAFGLNNTGVICYFNSFLQSLVGCTAFTRAVLGAPDYLQRTRTGAAVLEFVQSYAGPAGMRAAPPSASAQVLSALVSDLAVRRPRVVFGNSQESASEALIHLLDMIEPPVLVDDTPTTPVKPMTHPISQIFTHRQRCEVWCENCKAVVSTTTDTGVNFNLFHYDEARPTNPVEFTRLIRSHRSAATGYQCEKCGQKNSVVRSYKLSMVPEIIVCMFNIYGVRHQARYFPEQFELPGFGDPIRFQVVGQVEHAGGLNGGHYWARGRRSGGVFTLNDGGVAPSAFMPTTNTYFVMYHFGNFPDMPAPQPPAPAQAAPADSIAGKYNVNTIMELMSRNHIGDKVTIADVA